MQTSYCRTDNLRSVLTRNVELWVRLPLSKRSTQEGRVSQTSNVCPRLHTSALSVLRIFLAFLHTEAVLQERWNAEW